MANFSLDILKNEKNVTLARKQALGERETEEFGERSDRGGLAEIFLRPFWEPGSQASVTSACI